MVAGVDIGKNGFRSQGESVDRYAATERGVHTRNQSVGF